MDVFYIFSGIEDVFQLTPATIQDNATQEESLCVALFFGLPVVCDCSENHTEIAPKSHVSIEQPLGSYWLLAFFPDELAAAAKHHPPYR